MSLGLCFKLIKQCAVLCPRVEGRAYVLPKGVADLNSEGLGQLVLDTVNATRNERYPCIVVAPPNGAFSPDVLNRTSVDTHRLTIGFFTTSFVNGDGSVKSPNKNTNTSTHHISDDWNDMLKEAKFFLAILKQAMDGQEVKTINLNSPKDKLDYTAHTNLGDKRLSGVFMQLWFNVVSDCPTNAKTKFDANPITITPYIHVD
jgi:hypothetical protein